MIDAPCKFGTVFASVIYLCVVVASPARAQEMVIFQDTFDAETSGLGVTQLSLWTVNSGTVDVIPHAGMFNFQPGNGLYLDLDGTSVPPAAGTIESIAIPTLANRTYRLEFELAGSQRNDDGGANNSVDVLIGGQLLTTLALPEIQPFFLFTFDDLFLGEGDTTIVFRHAGGDNIGLLLDDVRLVEKLPTTTCILSGTGQTGQRQVGEEYELILQIFEDDVFQFPVVPLVESIEVVSGPNTGAPIFFTGQAPFVGAGYEYSSNFEPGIDRIEAVVQGFGQPVTCSHTVEWTLSEHCYAGYGRGSRGNGDRQVLEIEESGFFTWTICSGAIFEGAGAWRPSCPQPVSGPMGSGGFCGVIDDPLLEGNVVFRRGRAELRLSPLNGNRQVQIRFSDDSLPCSCNID